MRRPEPELPEHRERSLAPSLGGRQNGRLAQARQRIRTSSQSAGTNTAQLCWFVVLPDARGQGLGSTLLREAVEFARASGYGDIILWTVSALTAAARLYESAGFGLVAERHEHVWGVDVVHQQYELLLAAGHD